jgi:hypothetical protein
MAAKTAADSAAACTSASRRAMPVDTRLSDTARLRIPVRIARSSASSSDRPITEPWMMASARLSASMSTAAARRAALGAAPARSASTALWMASSSAAHRTSDFDEK